MAFKCTGRSGASCRFHFHMNEKKLRNSKNNLVEKKTYLFNELYSKPKSENISKID